MTRNAVIGPRGLADFRTLIRRLPGGRVLTAELPAGLEEQGRLTPTVVRALCAQLEIDAAEFGFLPPMM